MIGKRNKFNLSHSHITTGDIAGLYPVALVEVLPGDSIQMSTQLLARLTALVTPAFHPLVVKIHHWFSPMRQLWEDWDEFISGYDKDGNASSKTYPTMTLAAPA